MQVEAVHRVLERILALSGTHPDGVVAVDADGTLWSGDVGDDVMWGLVDRGAVLPVAHAAIVREVQSLGSGAHVGREKGVKGLLFALHAQMTEGNYTEELFCSLNAWMAAGRPFDEARALASQIAIEAGVATRLHAEMRAVLAGVRERGIEVFVVSASPRFMVEPCAAELGFDAEHIVAAEVAVHEGLLEPRVSPPIPYGAGKVTRLRERVGGRPLLAAFGDNAFDAPMLQLSKVPVAVRPKSRLRHVAGSIPGIVELAAD